MTVLEILLLAAGAVLVAASFFIPEKEEKIDTDISALVREEVKKSTNRRICVSMLMMS